MFRSALHAAQRKMHLDVWVPRRSAARAKWDADEKPKNLAALAATRGFVPPDVAQSTASKVASDISAALGGASPTAAALSKRVWSVGALRVVRAPAGFLRVAAWRFAGLLRRVAALRRGLSVATRRHRGPRTRRKSAATLDRPGSRGDAGSSRLRTRRRRRKVHIADLRGKYAVVGLDLTELRAVYAALPRDFDNDGDGAKAKWREDVRAKLAEMVGREDRLAAGETRNAAYRGLPAQPLFPTENVGEDWRPDAADPFVKGGASAPRRAAAPAGLFAALQRG